MNEEIAWNRLDQSLEIATYFECLFLSIILLTALPKAQFVKECIQRNSFFVTNANSNDEL